ncbi:MAG: ATP-dependent zinc metalloprotease FtsH [Chitinivibrionales bacterium]
MADLLESKSDKDGRKKFWEIDDSKDRAGIHKKHGPFSFLNPNQFNFSIWYFVAALLLLSIANQYILRPRENSVDYSEFKSLVRSGTIKRVEMSERSLKGFPYTKEKAQAAIQKGPGDQLALAREGIYRTVPVADPTLARIMDSIGVQYYAVPQSDGSWMNFLLSWILPFVIMIVVWNLIYRRMGKLGGGVMQFAQNKARLVAEGDTKTTFDDVAGADEAKEELIEVVDFLKNPGKYTEIGGKIPKGVLLVGPPGTGKTLLARAVAGEAKVPFFRMSGADFVEMFVGVGAARVRDLFSQAKEKAPCIIFIDELDAIGKSRSPIAGGNDEREQTLNMLLVEMDGFDSRTGVIILAATNRPEVLDAALLRPGRFDRQVLVDKPDLKGRESILKIHSKGVHLDESVDLTVIARNTAGFAGADLANIVNEAALMAVRAGRTKVSQPDFMEAIEKTVAGLQKKGRLINPKERRIVAHHETGHALTALFTPGSDPVQKISIVPRGLSALGYTMQTPTEDRYLMTKDDLLGKIDVLLGGRAAEQIIFGEVSTGASNDIDRATDIVRRMLTDYGMSEKFGNMVLRSQKSPSFLGEGGATSREYAESTQQYLDEQTARIIDERYRHVLSLLTEKKQAIEKVAAVLLDKEMVDAGEFRELAGEPAPGA